MVRIVLADDLLLAMKEKQVSRLSLLDLSVAFCSINHKMVVMHLQTVAKWMVLLLSVSASSFEIIPKEWHGAITRLSHGHSHVGFHKAPSQHSSCSANTYI